MVISRQLISEVEEVILNNEKLEKVEKFKYLDYICKKISKKIGVLRRCSKLIHFGPEK